MYSFYTSVSVIPIYAFFWTLFYFYFIFLPGFVFFFLSVFQLHIYNFKSPCKKQILETERMCVYQVDPSLRRALICLFVSLALRLLKGSTRLNTGLSGTASSRKILDFLFKTALAQSGHHSPASLKSQVSPSRLTLVFLAVGTSHRHGTK